MAVVTLGEKGQVSLPAGVLRKLGIQGAATLLVELTDDGEVVLRQAALRLIEVHSDSRLKEFRRANAHTEAKKTWVRKALAHRET